jgi:hypothetical protein
VLKTVLRSKTKMKSAGIPQSLPGFISSTSDKNKEESDASLESKTVQILAILPHLSPGHITHLLRDDRFGGNVERVLEGLLDGSLESEWEGPVEEEVQWDRSIGKGKQRAKSQDEEKGEAFGYDIAQRRNVFDNDELDVMRVRVGKQHVG